jgi:DNA polymerase III epsilon subunit-like protein
MRVFLDFEASSLGKKGYPIEVGWVSEDGQSEAYLITPAPNWTDWDDKAEAIHGISRATLASQGAPVDRVATRMVEVLSDHALYASAPSWDGKWLSVLLRAAGLPRHSLRLRDTEEARQQVMTELLGDVIPPEELHATVSELLEQAAAFGKSLAVSHRALADAEQERQIWLEARRLAQEERRRRGR